MSRESPADPENAASPVSSKSGTPRAESPTKSTKLGVLLRLPTVEDIKDKCLEFTDVDVDEEPVPTSRSWLDQHLCRHEPTETHSHSPSSGRRIKVRVIEPIKQGKHVRTSSSIAVLMFGANSPVGRWLFSVGASNLFCVALLWLLWAFGGIVGFFIITEHIHHKYVWLCTTMIPLPVAAFFVMSKDLIFEVLKEVEYYIICVLEIVWLLCAMTMIGDQRRMVWICYSPSLAISGFMDAYPAKYRALISGIFFASSAVFMICWDLMLAFSWCRWNRTAYQLGDIQGSLAGMTFTTSLTLLCFYYRQIYCAVFRPDCLVLIRSAVRSYVDDFQVVDVEEEDPYGDEGSDIPSARTETILKQVDPQRKRNIRLHSDLGAQTPKPWAAYSQGYGSMSSDSDRGESPDASAR